MKKTYLELISDFIVLNKEQNSFLSEENLFEFVYDEVVHDKTTFALNSNKYSINTEQKINNLRFCLENKVPWERVLKYSYFCGFKIILHDNVFSPRHETELIVKTLIDDTKNIKTDLKIYDFGSGTGCLNVAISNKLKNVEFINFELSQHAYKNTLDNIQFHNILNSTTLNIDYINWLKNNEIDANIIVCNPPYINRNFSLCDNVTKYDPELALYADDNGLYYYKEIINLILSKTIKKELKVYFEIGYDQKVVLQNFLISKGILNFKFIKDLNQIDRVLKIIFIK